MYDVARNRAVIIEEEYYKDLEFILWLYDIRVITKRNLYNHSVKGISENDIIVNFRCTEAKYHKLYEKMDSLGIWKGELINPTVDKGIIRCDKCILNLENLQNHYLKIGV